MPDSPELLEALGRSQQALGELNQAIATYNKVTVMQPMSPQAHLRLADAYMAAKNNEAATTSLHKAIEIKPDLVEAQRALIAVDVTGGRFQNALTTAKTVQKQRPKEAIGYLLEGDVYALQKNWDSAAVIYRAGLKQVDATELAVKLHSILLASGKSLEAEKFSSNWQNDHPKDSAFLASLSDSALMRKDYVSAEKLYLALIKAQPDSAIAYNNLAWVTGKLNKEGAVSYSEKANNLVPNQPAFIDTLAMLLSARGDYAKAVDLENKALALQPQNALFKLNLAKIHISGGKKDLARKELEEITKLGDKFPAQAEVNTLMKSL